MRSTKTLFIAFVFAILGFCCASIGDLQPKEPIPLGQFRYTQNPGHQGEPYRVIPIWIDTQLSQEDHQVIVKDTEAWNIALNNYIKLEVIEPSDNFSSGGEAGEMSKAIEHSGWFITTVNDNNPNIPKTEKGYWVLGYANIGGQYMYLVRSRLNYWDVFGVVLHEMGHLLGSDHVGIGLMYPHYSLARNQCIDKDSITAVAKYQKLPVENLNYCVPIETP